MNSFQFFFVDTSWTA